MTDKGHKVKPQSKRSTLRYPKKKDTNPYIEQIDQLREDMVQARMENDRLLSVVKLCTTGVDYTLKAYEMVKPDEPTEESEIADGELNVSCISVQANSAEGLIKHMENMFEEYGKGAPKLWKDFCSDAKEFKEQDLESKKAFLLRIARTLPRRNRDAGGVFKKATEA